MRLAEDAVKFHPARLALDLPWGAEIDDLFEDVYSKTSGFVISRTHCANSYREVGVPGVCRPWGVKLTTV